MTQDAKALLQRIRAIDLAILETGLYLNAYQNETAFTYLQSLTKERAMLADAYAKTVAPLTKNQATTVTAWTNTPWPWEMEAN